jgi:hypothetical protein
VIQDDFKRLHHDLDDKPVDRIGPAPTSWPSVRQTDKPNPRFRSA